MSGLRDMDSYRRAPGGGGAIEMLDLDRLYREHAHAVAGFARARMYGASERDVEDLTGEVFVRACRFAGRYREQGRERSWLLKIAHRRLIDLGRRPEARADVRRVAYEAPGGRATADAGTARHVARIDLRAALGHLSPRWRRVLVERYYHAVPSHETARRIGCSAENVRRMRRSGLRKLHHLLRAGGHGNEDGRIVGRLLDERRRPA